MMSSTLSSVKVVMLNFLLITLNAQLHSCQMIPKCTKGFGVRVRAITIHVDRQDRRRDVTLCTKDIRSE